MSDETLVPIKELWNKYSLGKTQFYKRMGELGVVPQKVGTQSYISPEELQTLDDLHQHILKGGTTPGFLAEKNGVSSETRIVKTGESKLTRRDQIPVELALQMFDLLETPDKDPLAPQRQLQEAADRGWVLGTKQLQEILGIRPREGQFLGFKVVRCGRSGRGVETGWKVSKIGDK